MLSMIENQLIDAVSSYDYDKAERIIKDYWFDPNFIVRPSGMPIATYILEMSGGVDKSRVDLHKNLIRSIMSLPQFNPNKRLDTFSGETMLMRIAKNSEYNWLLNDILKNPRLNIYEEDYNGNTALMTAVSFENRECEKKIMDFIGLKDKDNKSLMPRKISDNMKLMPNGDIIYRVEAGFSESEMKGENTLYSLILNFMWKKYDKCVDIVNSNEFSFNSTDKWGEPSLHSLIYYSNLHGVKYEEDGFKKIVDAFIKRKDFNVNALDCDCNNIPMVVASMPRMKWLLEMLFDKCNDIDMDIRNDVGMNLEEIATRNNISIPHYSR